MDEKKHYYKKCFVDCWLCRCIEVLAMVCVFLFLLSCSLSTMNSCLAIKKSSTWFQWITIGSWKLLSCHFASNVFMWCEYYLWLRLFSLAIFVDLKVARTSYILHTYELKNFYADVDNEFYPVYCTLRTASDKEHRTFIGQASSIKWINGTKRKLNLLYVSGHSLQ